MTLKDGFTYGALAGGVATLIAIGILDFSNLGINTSILSNVTIRIITLVALVFTPVIIWSPKAMDTTKKGFIVGFPWAVGIVGLLFEVYNNTKTE